MLADKIGQCVAEVFGGVGCPDGGNVLMLDHLGTLHVHDVVFLKCEGGFLVAHGELPPYVNFVGLFGQVHTRPLLEADGWRQPHDVLERYLLVGGIVDVHARAQNAEQERELCLVEASIGLVVSAIGQGQLVDVIHGQGEVIVVPALLDDGEDAVGLANLDQDEEQATGFLQDPFQVGVVCQVSEAHGAVEPLALPRLQAGGDKIVVDLLVDTLLGPPDLLQLVVRGDERVAAVAVDEGIEGHGLIIDHVVEGPGRHVVRCLGGPAWMALEVVVSAAVMSSRRRGEGHEVKGRGGRACYGSAFAVKAACSTRPWPPGMA